MSLSHAILGLLTVTPMTGYDLKHQAFDNTIAHFWQADQAQIYRTLSRMEESGWVESTLEIQEDRPNRKVYSITDEGRAELQRWMQSDQPLPVHREAFLVQMFFGGLVDNQTMLDAVAKQAAGHEAILKQYQHISIPALGDGGLDRNQTFWRLTLEFGIALQETYLRWLQQCKDVIENLDDTA